MCFSFFTSKKDELVKFSEFRCVGSSTHRILSKLFKKIVLQKATKNEKKSCYQKNKKNILSSTFVELIAHRRNQWDQMRWFGTSHSDFGKEKYISAPFVTKVNFSKKIDFQLSMERNWKVLSMLGFNSAK